jgi:ubiquinone/menaquinone biosynthesis C-methylase UbiE
MDFYISQIGLLTREQMELHQGQAESIPLPDSSCNYVFCVNALDHVERPEPAAKELARITKGLCLVSLHTVKPLFGPVHPVLKYVDSNHPHHFTLERVQRILAAHFDAVRVTHIATMTDDQPEFALKYFWRAKNKPTALLRWMSTLVLQSVYFNCEKS